MFCKCCNVCFNMSYLKAESIYNEEDEEDIADEDLEEDEGDDGDQVLCYTIRYLLACLPALCTSVLIALCTNE